MISICHRSQPSEGRISFRIPSLGSCSCIIEMRCWWNCNWIQCCMNVQGKKPGEPGCSIALIFQGNAPCLVDIAGLNISDVDPSTCAACTEKNDSKAFCCCVGILNACTDRFIRISNYDHRVPALDMLKRVIPWNIIVWNAFVSMMLKYLASKEGSRETRLLQNV